MGLTIGPATWHPDCQKFLVRESALGASVCGGRLFCRCLGIAWIVAPAATQVSSPWVGSASATGWTSLCTALINAGLTPSQWFIPNITQLQSGYACRTYWDSFSSTIYWSSTAYTGFGGYSCVVNFANGTSSISLNQNSTPVRAFRCVTY